MYTAADLTCQSNITIGFGTVVDIQRVLILPHHIACLPIRSRFILKTGKEQHGWVQEKITDLWYPTKHDLWVPI